MSTNKSFAVHAGRLALVLAVVLLAGCTTAFGKKVALYNITAPITVSGTKSVALASWDQRPYVVSGRKAAQFAGIIRGGYGNPFNLNTESGAPLADDFSQSIAGSLDAKGFKTGIVRTQPKQGRDAILDALRAANKERAVLVAINEWRSDTYGSTTLHYNVAVTVYGNKGNELASRTFTADTPIVNIGLAFQYAMGTWFSAPEIAAALK